MAGRKRSRAEWRALVAAWEGCGESQAAFCARRGIEVRTFRWWRWRLRQEPGPPASGWIEVRPQAVMEAVGVGKAAERPGQDLELVLGDGIAIRVPVGFDEATLLRLVRALGVLEC